MPSEPGTRRPDVSGGGIKNVVTELEERLAVNTNVDTFVDT